MTRTAGEPTAADLTQFEAANAGTRAAALARFLRGYRALEAKDNQTALVAFDSSDIGDRTSLGDYALLYEGRALVGAGRGADGARILNRVHDKYPESIVARDASIEAGRAAIAAGEQKAAVDYLQRLVEAGDGEALRMTADVLAARGEAPKAIALYRNAYFYDP